MARDRNVPCQAARSFSKRAGSSNGPTSAIQPLLLEQVLRDALDVLDSHGVELPQKLVGILDLALEHLAPEPVLDRALRALEA